MKRTRIQQPMTRALMTLLTSLLLATVAQTVWAADVTLQDDNGTKYVNMPATGTDILTLTDASITTFKVYDDGGKDGNYSKNCNGYLILTAPAGYALELSGNIMIEYYDMYIDGRGDYLAIYDGTTNSAAKLEEIEYSHTYGSWIDIGSVRSSGQSMMLYFKSYKDRTFGGLDLTVTLIKLEVSSITVNTATGGSVAAFVGDANVTQAMENDVVTLNATPYKGYLLSDLSVKDASNNDVEINWSVFTNTATFTMPNSAVTVTPTFQTTLTQLYINMPTTGTKTATIPEDVESFKVYDDGGEDGNYSDKCNGYLILTAPSGYLIQLSGSITTQSNFDHEYQHTYYKDHLTVYNGNSTSANKLFDHVGSIDDGVTIAIPTVRSSGQSMMLYFYSNGESNYDGFNLTVKLISTIKKFGIEINSAENGSIVSDKSEAKVNEVVTLTATPADGYMLKDITVKDVSGNIVGVTGGWHTGNKATFTMPGSRVSITPIFTNDLTAEGGLYLNMPATDEKRVTIPEGVQSFKVYDHGGKDGNYSANGSSYLLLTAPADYVLQLSGNITLNYGFDKLNVYDGLSVWDVKLLDRVSSNPSGTPTTITTVTSSGQQMMLVFDQYGFNNCAGLDLTVTVFMPLELANNANNRLAISQTDGKSGVKATLTDRTLLRNGDWNTLCLPFPLTAKQIAASPLAGATIKEMLTTSNLDGEGMLTLHFQDASTIEAGKPYIVRWDPMATITSIPIINPVGNVLGSLNFIMDVPTFDNGQATDWDASTEGPAKLVDGDDTSTKYGLSSHDPWVEFHFDNAITPKGYALWTADGSEGKRNPKSWTIKARVNSGDAWTTLATVDNSNEDKLPMTNFSCAVFALNNSTAYKYFRFEAERNANTMEFQLAGLRFCTVQPDITPIIPADIENPVFNGVTIDASAPTEITSTDGNVKFVGNYAPFTIDDSNINSILYVAAGNKIGYSKSARTLKTFRAHFWVKPNGGTQAARVVNLDFGDGKTTGISIPTSLSQKGDGSDYWYSLDGRKLQGKPTSKGVFILNGKKVVIK